MKNVFLPVLAVVMLAAFVYAANETESNSTQLLDFNSTLLLPVNQTTNSSDNLALTNSTENQSQIPAVPVEESELRTLSTPRSFGMSTVSSCTEITSPGYYQLDSDINNNVNSCINITADHVTLDCAGHLVDGTDSGAEVFGINVSSARNVTIANCTVTDFYIGVILSGTNDSTIRNCTSPSSVTGGFGVVNSLNNTISNCSAFSTTFGMAVVTSAQTLVEDFHTYSNIYGIYAFVGSHNNTFKEVTGDSNTIAIYIEDSSNNTVINSTLFSSGLLDVACTNGSASTYSLNNTFLNVSYSTEATSEHGELVRQWYVRVNVTGTSVPVSGASVTLTNRSSVQQASGSTGSDGRTDWMVVTEYKNIGTTTRHWTNYTASASYLDASTTFSFNFSGNSQVNVTLPEKYVFGCMAMDHPSTYYTLMADIESARDCLNITADNITLDCRGYGISTSVSNLNKSIRVRPWVSNSTVANCSVSGLYKGIWVEGNNYDVRIFNNTLYNNIDGLTLTRSRGAVRVWANRLENNSVNAININANNGSWIYNNTMIRGFFGAQVNPYGSDISITDNTFINFTSAVSVSTASNITVVNNTFYSCNSSIYAGHSQNITIANSSVFGIEGIDSNPNSVRLYNTVASQVFNLTLFNVSNALVIRYTNNSVISDITVFNSSNSAVSLRDSENFTISDLFLNSSTWMMELNTVTNITVANSTIIGATQAGIKLRDSTNNTIFNNTITRTAASMVAIDLESSPHNMIISNNLTGNYGVHIIEDGAGGCNHISGNIGGDSGKPILHRHNESGITIEDTNAYSEILLCGVHNSLISNVTVSNPLTDSGVFYTVYSENNTIRDSNLSDLTVGLYMTKSNNTQVINVTSDGGYYAGMFVLASSNVSIIDSTINYFLAGLYLTQTSSDNLIQNSSFLSNPVYDIVNYGVNNTFLNCTYDTEFVGSGAELIRKWYVRARVTRSDSGAALLGANVTLYNVTDDKTHSLLTDANGYTAPMAVTAYKNISGTTHRWDDYTAVATYNPTKTETFSLDNNTILNLVLPFGGSHSCSKEWECTDWSECVDGTQTRECKCDCLSDKDCYGDHDEERSCGGCESDSDCDDGDECTIDSCDDGDCQHTNICECVQDSDCDDADPCTEESCVNHYCEYFHTCYTCIEDSDCSDGVCHNGVCVPGCLSDSDCDDGDECTQDKCINNSCAYEYVCESNKEPLIIHTDSEEFITGVPVTIMIQDGDANLVDAYIQITDPTGETFTVLASTYVLTPDVTGDWKIDASRSDYLSAKRLLDVFVNLPEEEKDEFVLFDDSKCCIFNIYGPRILLCWYWWILLALIVAFVVGYKYRKSRIEEEVEIV